MTIPSELLRSIPREVRLTVAGRTAAVITALLFIGSLAVGAGLYALALRAEDRSRVAVSTPGRIVRLTATRGDHPRWVVTYQYESGAQPYEATARLGRRDRQQLRLGDTLSVKYLPADPATNWIEGYESNRIPAAVGPVAGISIAVAGVSLLIAIRRQMALLSYGRPAVARVTDTRKVGHGEHRRYRMSYEHILLSGAKKSGSLDMRKKPPAPGSEIIILYDPDNPNRRARYPLSLVRCVVPF
jgi:hypothetical protein